MGENLESDLYHKLEGEMNIFKVNATANMASFDRTVDLSIDLLDRMVRKPFLKVISRSPEKFLTPKIREFDF